MYQNKTPVRAVEESSTPSLELSATVGVEPKVPSVSQDGFFQEITAPQFLACLIAVGFLIGLVAWYLEDFGRWLFLQWQRLWGGANRNRHQALIEIPVCSGQAALFPAIDETPLKRSVSPSLAASVPVQFVASDRSSGTYQQVDQEPKYDSPVIEDAVQESELIELQASFAELESRPSSLEELTQSLQKKLDTAELELKEQHERNLAADVRFNEVENQNRQLQQQLADATANNDALNIANDRIASLEQDLGAKSEEVIKLQAAIDDAISRGSERADSLTQQFELQRQELASDLAEARDQETQTQTQLSDVTEQLKSLTLAVAQAEQGMLDQTSLADRLGDENAALKVSLKDAESRFSRAEDNAKQFSKRNADVQARLQEEIAGRQEALRELDSAAQEITDLRRTSSDFESKLDLHASEHREAVAAHQQAVEKLRASLAEAKSNGARFEMSCGELNAKIHEQESQLAASQQEVARLESELTSQSNDVQIELDSAKREVADLRQSSSDLESKLNVKADEYQQMLVANQQDVARLLASLEEAKSNETRLEVAFGELNAKITEQESELAASQQEVARLESELTSASENAQAELTDALNDLSQEQALHGQLQEVARQDRAELAVQVAKCSKQEARLAELEEQVKQSDQELANAAGLLEQEKSSMAEVVQHHAAELSDLVSANTDLETNLVTLQQKIQAAESRQAETEELLATEKSANAELTSVSQQLTAELNQKDALRIELETKLEELVQSSAEERSSQVKESEEQRLELDELRAAIASERQRGSEVLQKLAASEGRVEELQKSIEASSVNETNYQRLARKLVKYKRAFQESKSIIDRLSTRKSEMAELATEYLTMVKGLRSELDEQLRISRELQWKLDQMESGTAGTDEETLKRLVEHRAHAHVLEMKSQFEERIKQKNLLIRELRERQAIEG